MAGSGTGGNDPAAAAAAAASGGRADAADGDLEAGWREEPERSSRRLPKSRLGSAERERMVEEARAVTFPVAVRGYERRAVDRYVQEVNRLIAELEMSSSSESAVRHALAEVSEETRDILQRAHETADEVVLRARAKAANTLEEAERETRDVLHAAQREAIAARDGAAREAEEVLETARREAAELREAAAGDVSELQLRAGRDAEQVRTAAKAEADKLVWAASERADRLVTAAEARARELGESADGIWRERRRLVEDVRMVGEQLVALGDAESQRFARPAAAAGGVTEDLGEAHATDAELAATLQAALEDSRLVGGDSA